MQLHRTALLAAALATTFTLTAAAATPRAQQQAEFRNDKFGLLIAYGPKTQQDATGLEIHTRDEFAAADYEPVIRQFRATVDLKKVAGWCSLAKRAGARYVTFTAKHTDGYAMWKTRTTWGVGNRDVMRVVADSCHRAGVKVYVYFCLMDWHDPNYDTDWPRYLQTVRTQMTELLTRYGRIDGVWLDGMWDKPDRDWQIQRLYVLIHRLQPRALLTNNHHLAPMPGEDFQTIEEAFPGEVDPWGQVTRVNGTLPVEAVLTFGRMWYFWPNDLPEQPLADLLERARVANTNLLLGVGPAADGSLPVYVRDGLLRR